MVDGVFGPISAHRLELELMHVHQSGLMHLNHTHLVAKGETQLLAKSQVLSTHLSSYSTRARVLQRLLCVHRHSKVTCVARQADDTQAMSGRQFNDVSGTHMPCRSKLRLLIPVKR
jgi:hypothetical protein